VSTFVGRVGELGTLAEVAASATRGAAAAIVIGNPGSGKTRLLAEAQARVPFPDRVSIVGFEPERRLPLAAAAGLLRTLMQVPGHGSRLEELLFHPQEATALEPVRLFEAAHRAFRTLDPALLVIDDVHWMDELSFTLCHYLIRAAHDSGQRVAAFAATRPGEREAAIANALPSDHVTVIQLPPLTLEEGIELARGIDTSLDPARAADFWQTAQGSPFWLEALAQTGGVRGGLGQILSVRLRGAGSDAAALLGVLAVAGRPVSVTDAAAVAEWPLGRAEAALGELVTRGIAVKSVGAVRLTHDLIRESALADLPENARRDIHRRLAEQLELAADSDLGPLGEALEHRRAAGVPTLDLAVRLIGSPRRTLLGEGGFQLLAAIADESDPFDDEALALQEQVASLASELAEHEEALARWSFVAESVEGPVRRASALLAASRAAFEMERGAEARELLARSRQIDVRDELLDLEQRTHEAAILLWLEQRTADGRALAREAVAAAAMIVDRPGGGVADEARVRRAYLEALRLSYEAAMQEEDYEALLRVAQIREAEARGFDVDVYLTASLAVGVALRHTGRVREGLTRLRRVWGDTHRHVLPKLAVESGYWLARSLQFDGELVDAERVIREASDLAARTGDVPRTRYRVARAERSIEFERGEPWAALKLLEREAVEEPSDHMRIALYGDLAIWNARLGGSAAAATVRDHVAAGQACAQVAGCPRCAAELTLVSAEALARIGDRAPARTMLRRWDRRGAHPAHMDALVRSHIGALSEEMPETRAESLEAALAAATDSPYRLESLWMRLDLGLALAESGNDRSVGELQLVVEIARQLGAGTVQALAEQALRALGVRTWRRGTSGAPLTRREGEVAQLVAAGSTNREIAQTLFLSAKTVEHHVSNVLKKVGARNRTELGKQLRAGAADNGGNAR
jgi:DNA-binding CsgD family transcriptional regulator